MRVMRGLFISEGHEGTFDGCPNFSRYRTTPAPSQTLCQNTTVVASVIIFQYCIFTGGARFSDKAI